MENLETKSASVQSRRNFLKKAAYAAPAVIALGALTAPVSAHASIVYHQKTAYKNGRAAEITEHYDNVANYSVDGTFTPESNPTTVWTRNDIATAENNWIQSFLNVIFGRA